MQVSFTSTPSRTATCSHRSSGYFPDSCTNRNPANNWGSSAHTNIHNPEQHKKDLAAQVAVCSAQAVVYSVQVDLDLLVAPSSIFAEKLAMPRL